MYKGFVKIQYAYFKFKCLVCLLLSPLVTHIGKANMCWVPICQRRNTWVKWLPSRLSGVLNSPPSRYGLCVHYAVIQKLYNILALYIRGEDILRIHPIRGKKYTFMLNLKFFFAWYWLLPYTWYLIKLIQYSTKNTNNLFYS